MARVTIVTVDKKIDNLITLVKSLKSTKPTFTSVPGTGQVTPAIPEPVKPVWTGWDDAFKKLDLSIVKAKEGRDYNAILAKMGAFQLVYQIGCNWQHREQYPPAYTEFIEDYADLFKGIPG